MGLVKGSGIDFEFPVLGFYADADGVVGFGDMWHLRTCPVGDVEHDSFIGMELIDTSLRRWIVRSLELEAPLVRKRWWQIFSGNDYPKFDLELEEVSPLGFDDVKRRFIANVEIEDPEDEQAVRKATDIKTMIDACYMQCTGLAG